MTPRVVFRSGAELLEVAATRFAADPVRYSVIATQAGRADGPPPYWFATVEQAGSIIGIAMRTMPGPPHGAYLAAMESDAVDALAAAVLARGEVVTAANGALPAVQQFVTRMADAAGGTVARVRANRLFALDSVVRPPVPRGSLRLAGPADLDTLVALHDDFHREAERQAGRPDPGSHTDPERLQARLTQGTRYLLWEVDGTVVHLTAVNPIAAGAARIGPVSTPRPHRGRGYASHVVALAAQQILDAGARPCLYTDLANPVSNGVYARIGFVPVADEANLVVSPTDAVRSPSVP